MKQLDRKITITERLAAGFISAVLMLIISTIFVFIFSTMDHDMTRSSAFSSFFRSWFWHIVFSLSSFFGVLGFIVGSEKIAYIFGWFWDTNNLK